MPNKPAALVENEGPSEFHVSAIPFVHTVAIDTRPPVLAVSWHDYGHMVAEATLFFAAKQLKPGDRVAILGWDSLPWMVVNRAIQCLGGIVVPLYPNTTPEQIAHILNDSEPALLIGESNEIIAEKVHLDLLKSHALPCALMSEAMQYVPNYTGKNRTARGQRLPLAFRAEARAEFSRLSTQFTTDGAKLPYEIGDICALIYTSGSTSLPKGAMITHENIAASCSTLRGIGFDFSIEDVILHYLPFGHIYGKANGLELAEGFGVVSAFSRPEPEHLKAALALYQPSLLLGVPRVWNRIKAEIERQAGNGIKAKLLNWARKQKTGWRRQLADLLVFSSIRRKLGCENVRLMVSGSAAIPIETTEFFNDLGLQLREGYGLTETTGGFCGNSLTDFRYCSLGKPGPGAEIRLEVRKGIDDNEPNLGILWVRGKFVFKGYWGKPEKNKEIFDADGYFCTGDIVKLDNDGYLWYRGRATRQKKLDTGEFYNEETIQTALETNPLIAAAVPTGEGRPYIGAVLFPDFAACRKIAGDAPDPATREQYYCTHAAVLSAVQRLVDEANNVLVKAEDHKKWEQVRQFRLIAAVPTVDNGLLTPTLKIRNEVALSRYTDIVTAMYATPLPARK
jgi:long-chain acyl-CoA synthetase